jgi:hypothetical protein
MKCIIVQFSPRSVFLSLRSKYQHFVLKKPSVYVPPSKRETKFRTHTAQLANSIWEEKINDFGLNDNKHSLNSVFSWFHHECQSVGYRPQVSELCHIFKRFTSYSGSVLSSDDETWSVNENEKSALEILGALSIAFPLKKNKLTMRFVLLVVTVLSL